LRHDPSIIVFPMCLKDSSMSQEPITCGVFTQRALPLLKG